MSLNERWNIYTARFYGHCRCARPDSGGFMFFRAIPPSVIALLSKTEGNEANINELVLIYLHNGWLDFIEHIEAKFGTVGSDLKEYLLKILDEELQGKYYNATAQAVTDLNKEQLIEDINLKFNF